MFHPGAWLAADLLHPLLYLIELQACKIKCLNNVCYSFFTNSITMRTVYIYISNWYKGKTVLKTCRWVVLQNLIICFTGIIVRNLFFSILAINKVKNIKIRDLALMCWGRALFLLFLTLSTAKIWNDSDSWSMIPVQLVNQFCEQMLMCDGPKGARCEEYWEKRMDIDKRCTAYKTC